MTDIPFISLYDSVYDGSKHLFKGAQMREVRTCDEAEMIVFNGGADIGTEIYYEQPIMGGVPLVPSQRDKVETEIFNLYPKTFKLGICRGAQLLNCLNGGTLWQDVNNHTYDHNMLDVRTGETVRVTSTHHQMMRPHKSGVVIGVADEATRKYSEHDTFDAKGGTFFPDDHKDTEIVWYPATRSLCIQGHPEYVPGSHFAEYCFRLIEQCMKEINVVAA